MPNPALEELERRLEEEPSSPEFTYLAAILLEEDDAARAAEVCERGLEGAPERVEGWVLLGTASLIQGAPSEAMAHFDRAMAVDRDDPGACRLVAEALLSRGLLRSAVPTLKKALYLAPGDPELEALLEAAAAGRRQEVTAPSARLATFYEESRAGTSRDEAPSGGPPVLRRIEPAPQTGSDPSGSNPEPDDGASKLKPELDDAAEALDALPEGQRPTAQVPRLTPSKPKVLKRAEKVPALLPGFDAPLEDEGGEAGGEASSEGSGEASGRTGEGSRATGERPRPSRDSAARVSGARSPPPLPEGQRPTAELSALDPGGPRPVASGPRKALIEEVDDVLPEPAPVDLPRVTLSESATRAIAEEYEAQLQEELAAAEQRSVLRRYGPRAALVLGVVVAVAVGVIGYRSTVERHDGRTLPEVLAEARGAASLDTRASLERALELSRTAREMAAGDAEAAALEAWALSALASRFPADGRREEAERVVTTLDDEAAALPEALGARYLLADAEGRGTLEAELEGAAPESPLLAVLLGKARLEAGASDAAFGQLERAVRAAPKDVRALVGLGDAYRQAGDCDNALRFYGLARELTPGHPGRIAGALGCLLEAPRPPSRAALERELEAEVAMEVPVALVASFAEQTARARSLLGSPAEALAQLDAALETAPPAARARLQRARGDVLWEAGRLEAADAAYRAVEEVAGSTPTARRIAEAALLARARLLVMRGQPRTALSLLRKAPKGGASALARASAYAARGHWKSLRAVLGSAHPDGRYPPEAVALLALADVADGELERAELALASALKQLPGEPHLSMAKGKLEEARGNPAAALAAYEGALADPRCRPCGAVAWPAALLAASAPPESALAAAQRALGRDGTNEEALHVVARLLIDRGRLEEAQQLLVEHRAEDPRCNEALKLSALALHLSGRWKEAERAADVVVKRVPRDGEAHRVRAQVLFAKGDGPAGVAALMRAGALNPEDGRVHCELGLAHLRGENDGDAWRAFEEARKLEGGESCGLAGSYLSALPRSAAAAQRAVEARSKDLALSAQDRALLKVTLSRAKLARGSVTGALEAAREAVELHPHSGPAHHALALARLKKGRKEEAIASLERAVALDPTDATAHLAIANLKLGAGALEDAASSYGLYLALGSSARNKQNAERTLDSIRRQLAAR